MRSVSLPGILVVSLVGCASAPPLAAPPLPPEPCPKVAEVAPPAPSAVAPLGSTPTVDVVPVASSAPSKPEAPHVVIGPAKGGPRGVHRCEFRESVDTYARSCTIKVEADGSLTVTAAGTSLNPNNGFSFRMGGGPNGFDVAGKLEAFGSCRGPFSGHMATVLDGATKTYETRFRDHCMIVIR
jgi:hypothetical protein